MLDHEKSNALRNSAKSGVRQGTSAGPVTSSSSQPSGTLTVRSLHVRYIVAGNPNTPKEVLTKLACDSLENVRRRVAENPRTPVDVLKQLVFDESADVRLSVAENPNAPVEVIEDLARDENADVRYGVAENPHIPLHILSRLSEDENPYVAFRANRTLQCVMPGFTQ